MKKAEDPFRLGGAVWFQRTGGLAVGDDRFRLLEKIGELGSINRAARAVGVSYKTAWHIVDSVNNLSDRPLVARSVGGRGGGGTILTDEGRDLVRKYRILREEHRSFVRELGKKLGGVELLAPLYRRIAMRVSARNLFRGRINRVRKGVVNSEVRLSLPGGDAIVSIITNESVDDLRLAKGQEVYAVIKASSVLLGRDLHATGLSARNLLCGTVRRVSKGAVNADVTLTLEGGNTLTAVITLESASKLALKAGDHACAAFKASSVILGIDG